MKKVLLATTALALSAGVASAEMALTGSAVMGVGDNGTDTTSKMESYITFTGTGETSSGLTFGMSATLGNYAPLDGGYADDGTTAYVSGGFGTFTIFTG